VLHSDFVSDEARVGQSARKLFERLNPRLRGNRGEDDAGVLAIYDWEVVNDTGLDLESVRAYLRSLDGVWLRVKVTTEEHRVVGLSDR
jgi:hypothetical protein